MASKFLRLNGITKKDRIEMTSRLGEAISSGGGWIVDFYQYSNLLICINFEIPIENINKLYSSIVATGLQLDQETHELLSGYCNHQRELDRKSKGTDIPGTLQVTFIHNEPDMKRHIIAVPG